MAITYRVCAAVLARLPVDESGRRVFSETLADWRREPGALRGLAAVVRAVCGVALREVTSVPMSGIWIRVAAWSVAWALLGLGLSYLVYGGGNVSGATLAAWLVTGTVFFLPTAIFLSSSYRSRRVPILGLALTAAIVGITSVGWALPAANRVVYGHLVDAYPFERPRIVGTQRVFQAAWPPHPATYMSGRYAHDLPALVAGGPPGGWAGIQLISFTAAFVALCMVMPLVAGSLTCVSTRSRRLGMASIVVFVLYRGRIADIVAPDWVLWDFAAPWLPVAVIAAMLMAPRKRSMRS